jgi:hypothetical protein
MVCLAAEAGRKRAIEMRRAPRTARLVLAQALIGIGLLGLAAPALAHSRPYGAHAAAAPAARSASHCGQLPHHGLRASLPLHARGVSCARARKLVDAWHRKADRAVPRISPCLPPEGGEPSKTCTVEGWRCTAHQSLDGSTIPVLCEKARRRVSFKSPL